MMDVIVKVCFLCESEFLYEGFAILLKLIQLFLKTLNFEMTMSGYCSSWIIFNLFTFSF